MDEKETTRISKFISLVLRHKPETIELTLDKNGWTGVNDLIEKMNGHGFNVNIEVLEHIVSTNTKKRFAFNEDRTKIRANQGHSISVDVELKQTDPPDFLYHGTAERFVDLILEDGLKKMNRQHVHLSADIKTAINVGQRHGRPHVFKVAAMKMQADGFIFFLSENDVWLTDHVPAGYLQSHSQ